MSVVATALTWEQHAATGGTVQGYVTTARGAKVRLFTVSKTSIPGKRFVLRSDLPGFTSRTGRSAVSEAGAKAMAQQLLQRYVEILTATERPA